MLTHKKQQPFILNNFLNVEDVVTLVVVLVLFFGVVGVSKFWERRGVSTSNVEWKEGEILDVVLACPNSYKVILFLFLFLFSSFFPFLPLLSFLLFLHSKKIPPPSPPPGRHSRSPK